MKKAIITIFVTFFIAQCYAQVSMNFSTYDFYYGKNILKAAPLEKRTLVVKEYEYSKKQIKKMQKKGTYDKSMKDLKVQNDAMLKLVKDNWDFNTEIVSSSKFKTEEAYKENDKYLWLEVKSMTEQRKKGETMYSFSYSILTVRGNKKWYNTFANTGGNFNNLEFVAGLKFMQEGFRACEKGIEGKEFPQHVNTNAKRLEGRTLLIPAECTKMTVEEIKEKYPYDVQIVPISEIAEKVSAKDDKFAFYLPQHENGSCGKGFHHIIYTCEGSEPLALLKAKTFKFGNFGGNAPTFFEITNSATGTVYLSKILRKKTVEDFGEVAAQN